MQQLDEEAVQFVAKAAAVGSDDLSKAVGEIDLSSGVNIEVLEGDGEDMGFLEVA
jgi:hypothetical protein